VVYPGALERLFEEFEKEKKTAAAGPALVGEQGELQVSWGDKIHFFSELWKKVLGNRLSATRMRGNKEGKDVRWLSGACLMVRREAWNQSSGFDENFFLYFEDIDLCFRFHDLGWKLRYVPSSLVFHQGGASTEAMKMESRLHYRSSQLYFYKKHNHWISRAGLKLYFYLEYAGLSLSGRWKEKEHLRSWYRRLLKEK
jgi:N-acetylglucosaminyl-diphospho-decaprenol L-rhamnosyltransferase